MEFEWDENKNRVNLQQHGYPFEAALVVFDDPCRVMQFDHKHSAQEFRAFCFGKVDGKVLTVRFNWRSGKVRVIGVGHWRKGEKIYEEKNQ
ncbi:MAG: BrnT family toxin [Verrucomicrobiales bacterium]|jgi:uncharacterized DUF497 family protein|nr:BrnT family toxin [Verrucomicrobiales bacterium]